MARAKSKDEAGPASAADPTELAPLAVVGVGASAGGFEALVRMLGAVEPRSGLAFVVLQHLDPTHASHSVELIGHRTRLTVVPAEDGSLLAPDTVYVLPPNRFLSVKENRLQLTPPADSQGVRLPVDHFLRDLAGQWREKAVAIILSGTGQELLANPEIRAAYLEGGH